MYLNSGRLRPRVGKKKKILARGGGPPGGSGSGVRGDPRGGPGGVRKSVRGGSADPPRGSKIVILGVQNRHFGAPEVAKSQKSGKFCIFFAL